MILPKYKLQQNFWFKLAFFADVLRNTHIHKIPKMQQMEQKYYLFKSQIGLAICLALLRSMQPLLTQGLMKPSAHLRANSELRAPMIPQLFVCFLFCFF